MKTGNLCKNRKAISSIVGGIFFLVLMTAGFTVYYVALDSQSQMLDTQQIIADSEVAKIQEKFVVAASSDPVDNNRLSIQVVNTGNNPVEVADVWIINKTDVGQSATRYNVDYRDSSIPVGYSGDVLSNTALYLDPKIYDIKVVSTLGTIRTVEFDVNGGSNVLKAQMVAIPQDVRFGENATITLIVTNTGEFPVDDVQANSLSVSPNQCRNTPNPIFIGPADLAPSQSTMFFWDCILDPPIGNVITFTGNATGQISGVDVDSNNAFDKVTVRDFTSGSGDEVILKDELFGKPELFMIIPNPFGDTPSNTERGFWGVNIVNPTNKTMTVTKVSISALRANANDNHVIFAKGCESSSPSPHLEMVSPATGWKCPNENVLTWKNTASPISIERQSVYPFIVKISPDSLTGSTSLETVVVTTSAFTSLGAFGKGPYDTSIKNGNEAIANVYFSNPDGSIAASSIKGVITGVPSGSAQQFTVKMAEMTSSSGAIKSVTSDIIINIPKEWTYGGIVTNSGFQTPSITTFPDGSSQIVAAIDNPDLSNGARYLTFSVTAPANTGSNAKMYVFHILGSGTTTAATPFTVGPISETVVQVCPVSGGPPISCP